MSGLPSPGGVSPLLGGLSALASAVPAFFQGREMGMQNRLEQERLATEQQALEAGKLDLLQKRLGVLGPAAAIGAPGALDAFKQSLAGLTGLGAPSSGAPGVAPGTARAPQVSAPGAAPSSPAFGAATPGVASGGPAVPGGAQAPLPGQPSAQDRAMLESMGFLTPAQQFVRQNMKQLMQMQPQQRLAALQGAGVPLSEADEQAVKGLPFMPDPTLQNTALKTLDGLISGVQGGKMTPEAYKQLVALHTPQLLQAGVTPDLIAGLTSKHMTNLTQNAMLQNEKLFSTLALNKAQINKIQKTLPLEIQKDIAETYAANARGQMEQTYTAELPQRLSISLANALTSAHRLQVSQADLALRLQSGNTPGSPANTVNGMDKAISQQMQQLTNLRAQYRDFFVSKNGNKALLNGKIKMPNGQLMSADDLATQIQGLTKSVAGDAAAAAALRSELPALQNAQLHSAGAPGHVHIVDSVKTGGLDFKTYSAALAAMLENVSLGQIPYEQAVKEINGSAKMSPSQKSSALRSLQLFKP